MPKLDKAKERLGFLKFWLGIIVGVFTAFAGWMLDNEIKDTENDAAIIGLNERERFKDIADIIRAVENGVR